MVPVISHDVTEMVKELRFSSRDFSYLTTVLGAFIFFARTVAVAEKLRIKACLCDKSLSRNIHTSVS